MPEQKTTTKRGKKIRWFFLIRIVGIVLFIVILFNVDLNEIWQQIKKTDPWFFIFAVVFQIALLLIKAVRWFLLNDIKYSRKELFQSMGQFLESYALGVITPGRLGELMKTGYQPDKTGMIVSGLKVFAEKGLDVGIFGIIAGIALVSGTLTGVSDMVSFTVLAFGTIIFCIAALFIGNQMIVTLISGIFKRFSGSYIHLKLSKTIAVLILTLFSNSFAFLSAYLLALGIMMPVSFFGLSGGVAIAGLFNMIPITIMGLGTREITFLYIFKSFPESQVMALSALIFIVAQMGGGLLSMLMGQLFLMKRKKNE
jgi:uncharacterized membrane protein YbhN (UPF0104 family)